MLIVFEGIDGTGKTTLADRLAEHLRGRGREVVRTREPWDSAAGRQLRRLLAQPTRTSTAEEELELFHADRIEHVGQVVRPALARGAWVVQDRTFYSTAAYQGARGLDVEEILARSRAIAPEPDLTVLLELEPEEALGRIRRDREGLSSFERLDSLRAVARIYRELRPRIPHLVAVDAGRPLAEVEERVLALVAEAVPAPPAPAATKRRNAT